MCDNSMSVGKRRSSNFFTLEKKMEGFSIVQRVNNATGSLRRGLS